MTAKRLIAEHPDVITEVELSGLVVELARLGGWTLRYHTLRSKGSASGFPDWVLVKDRRLLFVELKSETGKVSAKQQAWLDGLALVAEKVSLAVRGLGTASVEVYVWRPSDWDEIVETLTGRKPAKAAA